jgi:hypothetical protein
MLRSLLANKVNIVGLLETRVKPHRATGIQKKFGRDWRWEHNYDHSRKGRIWLGC